MRVRVTVVSGVLITACGASPPPAASRAQSAVGSSIPSESTSSGAVTMTAPGNAGNTSSAAVAAPEAISGELPSFTLEEVLAMHPEVCANGTCAIGPMAPRAPTEPAREDGARTLPPTQAWIEIVRPGARLRISLGVGAAAHDLLGLVIAGAASVRSRAPRAPAPEMASAWTALLATVGPIEVSASGDSVALVLLMSPASNATHARDPIVMRSLREQPDLAWAHGAFHARIVFDAPLSPSASLELLMGSPNARVAEHDHPGSWETLIALRAAGRLHIPDQSVPGQTERLRAHDRAVPSGTIAYVPERIRHEWVPDGTAPLIAIQSYSPPGAEQRFRALAEAH